MARWLAIRMVGVVLVLAIGFGGGIGFDRYVLLRGVPPPGEPASARGTFGIFWEAWRLVEEHYVDPAAVSPRKLTYGAIEGMLGALQDNGHTRFLAPSEVRAERDHLAGRLEGIGIEVEMRQGQLTVVTPLDGSPAQRAGLRAGDVIIRVNGTDVSSMTLDQVSQLIRGPRGTTVHLTVRRSGMPSLLDIDVTRQVIRVSSVSWAMVPGEPLADIRVSELNQGTAADLRTAIAQARAAGARGIILDLRNNPGGLLDQAIKVSSEFIPSGDVLLEQDRSGQRKPIPVEPGGTALDLPLVVLVNHGTASGAEIIAGALQDHHRAAVVGEQTYGTGTVLNQFPLSDGSAILLGVREWLTPSGHVIWRNGIRPDQVIALPSGVNPVTPLDLRAMTPSAFAHQGDVQLLKAVQILGSRLPSVPVGSSTRA
ncbi:MAG: S41 family peptidase [Chloroflexi bacterium]|nr:S41 family peptidase [Chloroflexota bacterium]